MAMLNDKEAIVTIAVKDLDVARRFYEETVELKPTKDAEPGTLAYKCGNASVFVYQSQYAGTNKATAATWIVGADLDKIVDALSAKGVPFEHYDDLPDTKREGHIHIAGHLRLAWFKDPDGNILNLASG
jgi:catechol 2,3-dioxygenase-like lactoylglutathione lyase family enzyme